MKKQSLVQILETLSVTEKISRSTCQLSGQPTRKMANQILWDIIQVSSELPELVCTATKNKERKRYFGCICKTNYVE